jgi:hypothetical protein
MATTGVVVDTSVVVDPGRVVVLVVVEVGLVEDDDAGDANMVELPTVVSGVAAEQDATRTTANNAVGRAKDMIRTGIDRIGLQATRIQYQPGAMAVATFAFHERTRACCSPAQFHYDRARRIGIAISPPS